MSLRRLVPHFLILVAAFLPTLVSSQARGPAEWFEGARLIIGDKSPTFYKDVLPIVQESRAILSLGLEKRETGSHRRTPFVWI